VQVFAGAMRGGGEGGGAWTLLGGCGEVVLVVMTRRVREMHFCSVSHVLLTTLDMLVLWANPRWVGVGRHGV